MSISFDSIFDQNYPYNAFGCQYRTDNIRLPKFTLKIYFHKIDSIISNLGFWKLFIYITKIRFINVNLIMITGKSISNRSMSEVVVINQK